MSSTGEREPPSGDPIAPGPTGEGPLTQDVADTLEALMLKLATGERFERLGAIVHEHLLTSGRRARGHLAVGAARALGLGPELYLGWAAACELLYGASRIHDDIQDRSRYRRGTYSVWVRHGTAQAINAGDLLLMLPYLALEHVPVEPALRWALARTIAERAAETVRGQSLELSLLSSSRWNWPAFEEAVRGKTSAILVLPVQGAALLAGWPVEEAERVARRFSSLGVLLQIRDDVMDLQAPRARTPRGTHLREGTISAVIVEHLTRHPRDIEWLGPLLGKDVDDTTDEDVARAVARFEAAGTIQGLVEHAQRFEGELRADPVLSAFPALHAVATEAAIEASATLARLGGL